MVKIGNDVLEVWKSRHFGKLHKDRGPMATGGGLVEDSFVWFALRACSSPSPLPDIVSILRCYCHVLTTSTVCVYISISPSFATSSHPSTRLASSLSFAAFAILRCISLLRFISSSFSTIRHNILRVSILRCVSPSFAPGCEEAASWRGS